MATTNVAEAPQNILIIGAGVFGLSTALALLERPSYSSSRITVIDSAPTLPNPVGSSVDSSRIVRADYSLKPYATLATEAQELWRDTTPSGWGGEGRYHETGFVLTGDDGQEDYVRKAMQNVQELADGGETLDRDKIEELSDREAISKASGLIGVSGDRGYANWNSGWADAEASVAFALHKLRTHPQARSRVTIKANCKVTELLFTKTSNRQCTGVHLEDGSSISADLTILAAGAWTPSLFNLEYRCLATGQVIAYLQLTAQEQTYLENLPVIINFARGTFIIPPSRGELKIARHGYGYRNPQRLSPPSPSSDASPRFSESASISVPRTDTAIPIEAERTLRDALAELFPPTIPPHTETPPTYPTSLSTISTRPFTNTRICWYNDTPTSNFIIDYPPLSPDAAPAVPGRSFYNFGANPDLAFPFASSSLNTIPLGPPRLPSSHSINCIGSPSCSPNRTLYFARNSSSCGQRHSSAYSDARFRSAASTMYLPRMGKNLKPWPEPPVAIRRDLFWDAASGERGG